MITGLENRNCINSVNATEPHKQVKQRKNLRSSKDKNIS